MKKLLSTAIATALTATGLLATSATLNTAAAEVAFNAGVMSQYIFRGMTQRDTAAFNGGVDYTHNSGIYLGLWAAQVGFGTQTSAGLEYDIYGGYKTSLGGFDLGAGFTSYNYTEKYKASNTTGFDSSYQELNFSAGYGPISLTVNPGYHEGVDGMKNKDYIFYSLKGEYKGLYALYGAFDKKAEANKGTASAFDARKDGSYIQAGYKTSVSGFDLDMYLINSSKELNMTATGGNKDYMTGVFAVSKAF